MSLYVINWKCDVLNINATCTLACLAYLEPRFVDEPDQGQRFLVSLASNANWHKGLASKQRPNTDHLRLNLNQVGDRWRQSLQQLQPLDLPRTRLVRSPSRFVGRIDGCYTYYVSSPPTTCFNSWCLLHGLKRAHENSHILSQRSKMWCIFHSFVLIRNNSQKYQRCGMNYSCHIIRSLLRSILRSFAY